MTDPPRNTRGDPTYDDPLSYHTETCKTHTPNEYPRICLPEKINRIATEGEYLHLRRDAGSNGHVYIHGEKTESPQLTKRPKEDYKLSSGDNGRFLLTVPARWADEFVTDADPRLIVEVNLTDDDEFIRLYRLNDFFRYRLPELAEDHDPKPGKKGLFPAVGVTESHSSASTYVDLRTATTSPGQKFLITPFRSAHELFEEVSRRVDEAKTPGVYREVVEAVTADVHPEPEMVDTLELWWDPETLKVRETTDAVQLFAARSVEAVRVILPEQGGFTLVLTTDGATTHTSQLSCYPPKYHGSAALTNGKWELEYCINPPSTDYIHVFVPLYF